MTALFSPDQKYTRASVQEILGVPEGRRGGVWDTGYARYEDQVFIFCNVGIAGTTGHDYANRWEGEYLHWFGKTASAIDQPLMRDMLSGSVPVHLFWRDALRADFSYAGLAKVHKVFDETPARVMWRFDNPGATARLPR